MRASVVEEIVMRKTTLPRHAYRAGAQYIRESRIQSLRRALRSLLTNKRGQDLIEYALVVALIAFAAAAGMTCVATQINAAFTSIGAKVSDVYELGTRDPASMATIPNVSDPASRRRRRLHRTDRAGCSAACVARADAGRPAYSGAPGVHDVSGVAIAGRTDGPGLRCVHRRSGQRTWNRRWG